MPGPLTRLDPQREPVSGGRQRAGGVRAEDAGRVVRAVEVDEHGAVGRGRRGVKEATATVGLSAVRGIAEDEPQLAGVAALQRVELVLGPRRA